MQDLELLKIRTKHYKPIFNSLKKKKITYKENLLLYEISINKNDHLKLKKLVKNYIRCSIEKFYNIKLKPNFEYFKKFKKLLLDLPNITPNGVIVPKKENIKSYLKLQNYIFSLCKKYCLTKISDKIELCEVRLMRSNKYNYDSARSYSSTKIHSDSWSGNPCDSKVVIFIDGDKNNTIEFFKPKKIDKSFFHKKKNYQNAIKKYGFKKIKKLNYKRLTIFDQACLHRTKNKDTSLRLSLDFGIMLKSIQNKKILLKRYKKRFLNKKVNLLNLKKILALKSIHEKFN